jgi:hypothetical protein
VEVVGFVLEVPSWLCCCCRLPGGWASDEHSICCHQ